MWKRRAARFAIAIEDTTHYGGELSGMQTHLGGVSRLRGESTMGESLMNVLLPGTTMFHLLPSLLGQKTIARGSNLIFLNKSYHLL